VSRLTSNKNRNIVPRFTPANRKANQAFVAWLTPIPGTTKRHRLEENLGAAAIELTSDDLREIDRAASQITVHGARYPEQLERMTGR
jgi:diketogulonate reductase-like aldo/keto reductase